MSKPKWPSSKKSKPKARAPNYALHNDALILKAGKVPFKTISAQRQQPACHFSGLEGADLNQAFKKNWCPVSPLPPKRSA